MKTTYNKQPKKRGFPNVLTIPREPKQQIMKSHQKNSCTPVVCEQAPSGTFLMEGQQGVGKQVAPVT